MMGQAGSADAARTIGQGATTGMGPIDAQLKRLTSGQFEGKDKELLDRLANVLAALPASRSTLKCGLSVVPADEQATLCGQDKVQTMLGFWAHWGLEQAKSGMTRRPMSQTKDSADRKLGEIKYPLAPGDVLVRFFRHPDDADKDPNRTLTVEGSWAAIRLLHGGSIKQKVGEIEYQYKWRAASRSDDGKTWLILILVPDDKATERAVYVEMQFEKALPKVEDWPQ